MLHESHIGQCGRDNTHHMDTIQLPWHALLAVPNMDSPIRLTVGMMVSGPMNRIRLPMIPVQPMNTCTRDARMRPPES